MHPTAGRCTALKLKHTGEKGMRGSRDSKHHKAPVGCRSRETTTGAIATDAQPGLERTRAALALAPGWYGQLRRVETTVAGPSVNC